MVGAKPIISESICHYKLKDNLTVNIFHQVSDQGASLFGSFGFERGDVKITLGTGAFMDVNTGSKPHASVKGENEVSTVLI